MTNDEEDSMSELYQSLFANAGVVHVYAGHGIVGFWLLRLFLEALPEPMPFQMGTASIT
jgi:hypothetical protein